MPRHRGCSCHKSGADASNARRLPTLPEAALTALGCPFAAAALRGTDDVALAAVTVLICALPTATRSRMGRTNIRRRSSVVWSATRTRGRSRRRRRLVVVTRHRHRVCVKERHGVLPVSAGRCMCAHLPCKGLLPLRAAAWRRAWARRTQAAVVPSRAVWSSAGARVRGDADSFPPFSCLTHTRHLRSWAREDAWRWPRGAGRRQRTDGKDTDAGTAPDSWGVEEVCRIGNGKLFAEYLGLTVGVGRRSI